MAVNLGDRVRDRITKLTGIVVGITYYLYGCTRVAIQPEEGKDGKPAEWIRLDEPQVELIDAEVIAPVSIISVQPRRSVVKPGKPQPGGPRPAPANLPDPTR
jgi:hypothetical protein